jgi:dTDP-4-dehydrorhamnose reductase
MQRGEVVGPPRHVVVLGASGLLGHVVYEQMLQSARAVTAVMRRPLDDVSWWPPFGDPPPHAGVIDGIDATDWDAIETVLDRLDPDVVVNCIGVTPRRAAASDAIAAIRLNALLPHLLATWAAPSGRRLITISTDCVFGHEPGGFVETSPPTATDLYGRTKALGEVVGSGVITLRTSFVGRELSDRTELLEWFLQRSGGEAAGYADVWYSGVPVDDVASVIRRLAVDRRDLDGLFHLAADEPISKLELLGLANAAFGADVAITRDSSVTSHRTLDGAALRAELGLAPVDWAAGLERLASDHRYDLRPHARMAS